MGLNTGASHPYLSSESAARWLPNLVLELNMLGLFARWGHNVLITTIALLTIAMLAFLIK
jgi:hypothetical protein